MKVMILSILILCIANIAGAEQTSQSPRNAAVLDYTEGGHYDTDYHASFMSEWWYLNGDMKLVAKDGEKKRLAFFAVMAHQESPELQDPNSGIQLSYLSTFYGLYPYGETTTSNFTRTLVPRSTIGNYVEFHVPYVNYTYPEGLRRFYGSGSKGYTLNYSFDNMQLNLFFKPRVEKTIDHAIEPVNFTTYERAYGKLEGSVVLDGKEYKVTQADGYFDHMIPYTPDQFTWEMETHGWSWSEITTDNYQTIFYGLRSVADGYGNYSYKHLTLINKHTGKVIAEYSGDNVNIVEKDWKNVIVNDRPVKRPSELKISTPDLDVSMKAQNVVQLDKTSLPNGQPIGFVDFMAFQPQKATIKYKGDCEKGTSFYEYMVTDWGISASSQ
jgi:predicted secreted hydrolase